MTCSYIALGANLGDAVATLHEAIAAIAKVDGITLGAQSAFYRTAPVGLKNQPDFINAAVQVETSLSAEALLQALFDIEQAYGRQRSVPNAARTLDLDLLLHGSETHHTAALTLPHPRMHERAFVLAPLADLAPQLLIPGQGVVAELLARCQDQQIAKMA